MARSQPTPLPWSLERSVVHLLHRASQTAEDHLSRCAAFADVTPRQFSVLAAVAREPNVSQTELVNRTGIDRSTMADIVRRLVRNGLLSRSRTREDARAYAVRLTPRAQELVTRMGETAVEAEASLLESLADPDRARLVDLLGQLIDGSRTAPATGMAATKASEETFVGRQ